MSNNIIIDGRELTGVTVIKARQSQTQEYISFVDTSDANASASDIASGKSAYVNGLKILGTNDLSINGLVDGTISNFIMPYGKTQIAPYRFYQMTALQTADLQGVQNIGQYAFDGCTYLTVVLPNTLTNIGQYAFRNAGNNSGHTFVFAPTDKCSVGNYAFNTSKISKINGKFNSIGSYAFASCTSMTEIDVTDLASVGDYAFQNCTAITKLHAPINGAVGTYAFYSLYNVNNINIDNSNITSLGNYAFSRFAGNRNSPENNIITLDFSNSTFKTISQYAFGGDNSSNMYKNRYMVYKFPETVNDIQAYAFRYSDNCDFYFTSAIPPALSVTTAWQNATNYRIFVPYQHAYAYCNATNWTVQSSHIKGYAPANTFSQGYVLPEINPEGYGLTWYSDKNCTIAVTTVEDETAELYCVVGDVKLAYAVKITEIGCGITVSDGTNVYQSGDVVRIGTVLTITGTPTVSGHIPYFFKVNGEDFTSGNTITVDSENISITAIYYDGQNIPLNPTFSENTWEIIENAFKEGIASQFWQVGDTKQVTLKDGNTYTIRIADMQQARYTLTNGGVSNGVFEFVELVKVGSTTTFKMNSSGTNAGGWANSYMRSTNMPSIEALLPDDMFAAISEVNVLSGTGGGSTSGTSSSANKLFLPAEMEISSSKKYSIGNAECPLGQFDYYKAHNTSADIAKKKLDSTSNSDYWLRSPRSGHSSNFCLVNSDGSFTNYSASYAYGVSPCFAI